MIQKLSYLNWEKAEMKQKINKPHYKTLKANYLCPLMDFISGYAFFAT